MVVAQIFTKAALKRGDVAVADAPLANGPSGLQMGPVIRRTIRRGLTYNMFPDHTTCYQIEYMWTAMDRVRASSSVISWIGK